jgi:uracil phosphoribosyltransferase
METINLSLQHSLLGQYMAELRDSRYQTNRLLFRNNIRRIGQVMAYELSKRLSYRERQVQTPLGMATVSVPADRLVLATVLRAGLPMHEGFLDMADGADNAFVTAYREYTDEQHSDVSVCCEYMASPSLDGKVLVVVDPMLAAGGSMYATLMSLLSNGTPRAIHICCVVAAPEGIELLRQTAQTLTGSDGQPMPVTLWAAAIDDGLNEHKYIVPGLGDAGDLCFGEKLRRK